MAISVVSAGGQQIFMEVNFSGIYPLHSEMPNRVSPGHWRYDGWGKCHVLRWQRCRMIRCPCKCKAIQVHRNLALQSPFWMVYLSLFCDSIDEDDSEDGLRKALTFMGTAEFLQVTIDATYCSFRYVQGLWLSTCYTRCIIYTCIYCRQAWHD